MRTYAEARDSLTTQLQDAGWTVAQEALEPLGKIDFARLVIIHDHEERFLEQTFIKTLLVMRAARSSTFEDQGKVTADDVETALRMLGVAITRQPQATLSKISKAAIKDACGFC